VEPDSLRVSAATRLATPVKILHAAVDCIVAFGATNLSMQNVADAAGVSKGLIHYHYHDRETLLTRLVEWIANESATREAAALQSSAPKTAVDDLWEWVAEELTRGHLRVLIELSQERGPMIARAVRDAARQRRATAVSTVERLFELLELRLRVPVPLVAAVLVAFIDGLAINAVLEPDDNRRVAFDVFWLSLLSLAE
jgi:AcrR family transcriptional regulator